MTVALSVDSVANKIKESFPSAVLGTVNEAILVDSKSLFEIARLLKDSPEFDLNYLNHITAVDYYDYFEVTYLLTSLGKNHAIAIKARCYGRENPTLPSLVGLWRGADLQEREIYDLMGIRFEGHPNLKRIFLWEGFKGFPQRKDYL